MTLHLMPTGTDTAAAPPGRSDPPGLTTLPVRAAWRPVVLGQTLRLSLRSLLAWGAGLAAMAVLYVSIWPSFSGNSEYARLIDSLPQYYRSVLDASGSGDLSSAAGYLNAELFAVTGPMLIIILAVVVGTAAVAGPERDGRLAAYLAEPITRWRWVVEQALAIVLQVAGVVAVLAVALVLIRPLGDMNIGAGRLVAACVHLAALGLVYAALALAVGAATGRAGLTRAVTGFAAVLGYLVQIFAPTVDWIGALRPLSPFRWYAADAPLTTGVHLTSVAILLGASAVLVAVGGVVFTRRNLIA
jgi:ABC-2 type transport system permease protein